MDINQFNRLSETEKYELLSSRGIFIDTVREDATLFILFAMHDFWIEVNFDLNSNSIMDIGSFVCGPTLDKYSNVPSFL